MSDPEINHVFGLIAEIGLALKIDPLKGKTWILKIDERWSFALNGMDKEQELSPGPETMGCNVPPYHAAIFYNGWLAGLLSPTGGAIAAGEGANEANLIEALKGKLADVIKEN